MYIKIRDNSMRYVFNPAMIGGAALFLSGCTCGYRQHGPGHMYGYGGTGMWIIWIVVLIALGYGAWILINKQRTADTPLEILKKRYASGEITKEEYERMKSDLGQG